MFNYKLNLSINCSLREDVALYLSHIDHYVLCLSYYSNDQHRTVLLAVLCQTGTKMWLKSVLDKSLKSNDGEDCLLKSMVCQSCQFKI